VPLVAVASTQSANTTETTNENSNSSLRHNDSSSSLNEMAKIKSWSHFQKLFSNVIHAYNSSTAETTTTPIDDSLPLIVCSFSKGCVVLNQLCSELVELKIDVDDDDKKDEVAAKSDDLLSSCQIFSKRLRHLIWLDGGHSGTCFSWITNEQVIALIKRLQMACYVFVTPYQMESRKIWAIEEHRRFSELLLAHHVSCKQIY
jgi:hypothetical protein